MATIKEIVDIKGSDIQCIDPGATVLEAVEKMTRHGVGSLLVLDGRQVRGIFTETDVLRRVVAGRRDAAQTRVEEVMTAEVIVCSPETMLEEARAIMKTRRLRHLPVVDQDQKLCGLVSIGDLNAFRVDDQELTIHHLREYLYGRACENCRFPFDFLGRHRDPASVPGAG